MTPIPVSVRTMMDKINKAANPDPAILTILDVVQSAADAALEKGDGNYPTLANEYSLDVERMLGQMAAGGPIVARSIARESLLYYIYKGLNGTIIQTTSALDQLLENTSIENVPASAVRLPFDACYFQFPKPIPFAVDGSDTGIIGAYVFTKVVGNQITWSLSGTICQLKDTSATRSLLSTVNIVDLDSTEGLISGFRKNTDRTLYMHGGDPASRFHEDQFYAGIEIMVTRIIKTMIYMNLDEARKQHVRDETQAIAKLSTLGAKKRGKLESKLARKYDYILVGPDHLENDKGQVLGGDADRSVSVHWRRGHMRYQRHGENWKESKLVWIKPVLVNAAAITEEAAPEPKRYVVRP